QSHKKLAYYTYKKMVEVLEDSDWKNIQAVRESDDVHVYKFVKNGKAIYVAWWDYFNDPAYTRGKAKPVTITGLQGSTATVTEAVPRFSSGAEVTDFNTAFNKGTLSIVNGTVTLTLGENPVFVEVQ
ncbi:MAG: hypothetical protein HY082_01420, partial [Gammaproteobacteria bacterium]|nr:hypothetical protein [Gammaproteobacteria bacterium]